MMLIKIVSLLSVLATKCTAGASVDFSDEVVTVVDHHRSLQGAAGCLALGSPFTTCCPSAMPNDGICTLLWCLRLGTSKVELRDNCKCTQIEKACGQVSSLASFVPPKDSLTNMCKKANTCCATTPTTTTTGAWNTCMKTAIAGGMVVPNFDAIIPGGVPKLDKPTKKPTKRPTKRPTKKRPTKRPTKRPVKKIMN